MSKFLTYEDRLTIAQLLRERASFGQLYWYGIEVLKKYKPKWFVAENVSGIRSAGSGDFKIILDDMRAAGYNLTVNLYKAEQYGIPQTRH